LPVTCLERSVQRPRRTRSHIITVALQLRNDLALLVEEVFDPSTVRSRSSSSCRLAFVSMGLEIPRRASGSKLSQGHVALCDPVQ
jgi:hypothetical protein